MRSIDIETWIITTKEFLEHLEIAVNEGWLMPIEQALIETSVDEAISGAKEAMEQTYQVEIDGH